MKSKRFWEVFWYVVSVIFLAALSVALFAGFQIWLVKLTG